MGWGGGGGSKPKRTLISMRIDDVTNFTYIGEGEWGGGWGLKNPGNFAYVLNGLSLSLCPMFSLQTHLTNPMSFLAMV